MRDISLDFFLLMSNIAQVEDSRTAVRFFLEAINNFDPRLSVRFEPGFPPQAESGVYEVRTINQQFGAFSVEGDMRTVHPAFPALFQNAVQMLAVILERNRQREELRGKSERLQTLVDEKIASIRRSEALLNESQRMTKVGGWEWDIVTNSMYWTPECYRIHDLAPGAPPSGAAELIGISKNCYRPEDVPSVMEAFTRCVEEGTPYDQEFPFITTKGRELWVRTAAHAVRENGRIVRVVGSLMDITDHKRLEERLRTSLAEREILIRELYHRTKNNMNVISSLLDLKSSGLSDPQTVDILRDMSDRIRSMALVHSKLYQSRNLSRIDLGDYLREVVNLLVASRLAESRRISLAFDLEAVEVTLDSAVPVGLVVNEAVTNAFKYAFPEGRSGKISVSLHREEDGRILLSIADNGVGIPEGEDPLSKGTLGWQIITGIARGQLDGDLEIETSRGVRFDLRFSGALYGDRV